MMIEQQPPIVSVVLPVRNAAETIDDALNSVFAQTFRTFEVVAVDDGSTDGTLEILRRAAARDSRLRVVSTSGGGITAALNRSISLAAGSFIARQDADDTSMPQRFERQVEYLERCPRLCAVGTGAVTIDVAGNTIDHFRIRHGAAAVRKGLRTARVTPVHGSMMIRRDCLVAAGGYREAFVMSQDFDLWLRLLERYDIDNIEECLYRWRLTPGSVYGARRHAQLLYCGIGLAFAAERARFGNDSYTLLERSRGDLEAFVEQYRLRGLLRSIWGDLLLRGINDAGLAHRQFRLAVRNGYVHPRTLLLWAWTTMGLGWPGTKPLRAPELDARAKRGGEF